MCGINGFNFKDDDLIKRMMFFTKNRGPDFNDYISSQDITLGHDRLSILDLNKRSNQPYKFKQFILSYNGEIYNYIQLKKELIAHGYQFKTTSDTEVIIYLFDKFGIDSFKKLSGIFAISLWDMNKRILYLIRDIVGVKPLYYFSDDVKNNLIFSSSIKSILEYQKIKKINHKALFFYKNIGRNDSSETFFSGIKKLLPGQLLIQERKKPIKLIKLLKFEFSTTNQNDPKKNIQEIIKSQFASDVPVSLSLSGGYDSNIIYHAMRGVLEKKNYELYSFYFHDYDKFNEDFKIAKINCKNFGDNLNSVEVKFQDFQDNIEKVTEILEEPLSNQSAILNYLMAKNVKEKVIFNGDGGDEVFGGYDHYRSAYILSSISKINFLKGIIKPKFKNKNINRLFFENSKQFFLSFNEGNLMKDQANYFINFQNLEGGDLELNHSENFKFSNRLNDICFMDIDTKITNDFLRRNDSIFMHFGIEARVPFLDQKMIENYLFMDEKKKYGNLFKSKFFLKNSFKGDFETVKTKWGLQSPVAKWMKKELQPFLHDILNKNFYDNSKNYLNFKNIENLLKRHKEEYYNPDLIWSLVSFQIFLKKFKL
mgnify:CR=1 FL=1